MLKANISQGNGRMSIDVWDEEGRLRRSITLTVAEVCDSDGGDRIECELVIGNAVIVADEEAVTVKNKLGSEITIYLPD
jgi:hypothetical protein